MNEIRLISGTLARLPARARVTAICLGLALSLVGPAYAGNVVSWSKSFNPPAIGPGSVSTLTFTINNISQTGVRSLAFTDQLPGGMVIATPANATIDCTGTLIAPNGGTSISLSDGEVPANGSCTIRVDVTASQVGSYGNETGNLTSDAGNSGSAFATLRVLEEVPGFQKAFSPSTVPLGGRSTLTFTIDNSLNEGSRNQLTFTDNLPAGMVVANPANVTTTCNAASITAVPGTSVISLAPDPTVFPANGMVSAFASCTVSVDVVAQGAGSLHNVTGELTSTTLQNFPVASSGKASTTLNVLSEPLIFTKTFIDDPVAPGGTVTMEYSITNRDRDLPATGIQFTDNLSLVMPGLVALDLPENGICGTGSQLSGSSLLTFTSGRVGAGETCTFRVNLQLPASSESGAFPSTTSQISGTIGSETVTASPGSDLLFVSPVPTLTKEFIDDPVVPGGTVTMRLTLTNTSLTSRASNISFEDELPPELVGASNLPQNGFCGTSSSAQFIPPSQFDSGRLIFSGMELPPGQSCVFTVVLEVAAGATTGSITNTTGPITAFVDDVEVTGNPASDDLVIVAAPQVTASFLDDPIMPGSVVTLQFTLTHSAEVPFSATDISFTDDLNAVIPGMVALGLPRNDVCGAESVLRGTSVIELRNGTLRPGESCVISVQCRVPESAPLGSATNTTSPVTATVGGLEVMSAPGEDELLVTSLLVSKKFLNTPVIAGETTTLEFTISNQGQATASNIAFTDDLDDFLPGLSLIGPLPTSGVCGPQSSLSLSASNLLIFQNGTVPGGASCTFSVRVLVPPGTPDGFYPNTTSAVTATIGKAILQLPAAQSDLQVQSTLLQVTKNFVPSSIGAGGSTLLQFNVTNLHPSRTIRSISFSDTLPGGLTSTAGTISDVCGVGSFIDGTNVVRLNRGILGPGETCIFSVPISVPGETVPGTYTNTTSEVDGFVSSLELSARGDAASADLLVLLPGIVPELVSLETLQNESKRLRFLAVPSRRYRIQWSMDLEAWIDVNPVIIAEDPIEEWTDSGPPATPSHPSATVRRFYRAVLVED